MSGQLLDTYPSGATIYAFWGSYSSAGASASLSGLATSDILIYKNGSTTQRSSTAGFALLDTDGTDFDSVTGLNGISIDLSDNTDAGFYAVGSQYTVVISTVTIDSQTVTFVLGSFRIMAAEGVTGKPKVDVDAFGGTAGTFASGRPEVNTSHIAGSAVSTSSAQIGVNVVNAGATAWNSGAIKAATFAADVDAEILSYIVDDATRIDASALNTASVTTIPAILTDTGTDIPATLSTIAGYIDTEVAAILAAVDTEVAAIKAKTDSLTFTVAGQVDANALAISGDATAADNLETMLDGTGGKALTLGSLTVDNSAGTAVTFKSSGSNGHGLDASGNGTGAGIRATGGATGNGLYGRGGSTSGAGIQGSGLGGNSSGIGAQGNGSAAGLDVAGGATGAGIRAFGGANGHGAQLIGGGTTGDALNLSVTSGDEIDDSAVTTIAQQVALNLFTYDTTKTYADAVAGSVVAEGANAVWEEKLSDHSGTSGSAAEQLAAAGAAGDPWATALPGSYTSGQAGQIVGDFLDVAVSTRLATAGYTAPDNASIADILTDTGTTLPATLAGIEAKIDTVDANVDSVLADTGTDGVVVNAAGLATDAVDEIVAGILAGAITELASVPGASPTLKQALAWLYMAARNKRETTSSTDDVFNDAGSSIAQAALSDSGTKFTRGEYA